MVLKVNVGSGFHLEALQSVLSLGNSNIVLSHGSSPFQIRAAQLSVFSQPRCRVRRNVSCCCLLSAFSVQYRFLGGSRCNSIVDRTSENIDSKFCQRTIYRINSDRVIYSAKPRQEQAPCIRSTSAARQLPKAHEAASRVNFQHLPQLPQLLYTISNRYCRSGAGRLAMGKRF